jgi:hypothetical protein
VLTDEFSNALVAIEANHRDGSVILGERDGQRVESFIDVVEDLRELRETLRISMSAAARGFGGRASAHYSLYRDMQFNSNDVFALLHVVVINDTEAMVDPCLSKRALTEWTHQPPSQTKRDFVRVFGDSYVSSITSGGELFAIFQFHSSSQRERQTIKADAKAKFASFKVSMNYEKLTELFEHHTNFTSRISQVGTNEKLPGNSLADLLKYAEDFPNKVNPAKQDGVGVQIFFTASPISKIPDQLTDIYLVSRPAQEKLEDIARVQDQIMVRLGQARFAKGTPALFPGVAKQDMETMIDELERTQIGLERLAEEVADHRFEPLDNVVVGDVASLPRPPSAGGGGEIPIKVMLAAVTNPKSLGDLQVNGSEWADALAIFGLTIWCDQLAAGTELEYQIKSQSGQYSGWLKAGQTAKQRGMIIELQARVVGSNADQYSVRYAIKVERLDASFYAADGEVASCGGMIVRAMKISLFST